MAKKNSSNLLKKNNIHQKNDKKITNTALREASQKVYISFNWSFLTTNNRYNVSCLSGQHSVLLIKRIFELSSKDLVSITANTSKKYGLEKLSYNKLSKNDKLKKCLYTIFLINQFVMI